MTGDQRETVSLDGWHEVWHAAHKPGDLVTFLNWVAAEGYRLTKGEPLAPIDPEWAWTLAATTELPHEEP